VLEDEKRSCHVTDIKLLGYVHIKFRTCNFEDYASATQRNVLWYVADIISEKSVTFVRIKMWLLYHGAGGNSLFPSNKLHGVTSQKKVTFMVTELRTPNFTL
jgi:hypothetical protein